MGGDGVLLPADVAGFLDDGLARVDEASLLVAALAGMLPGGYATSDFMAAQNAFVTYVDHRPHHDIFFVGDLPSLASETNPVAAAAGLATGGTLPTSRCSASYWPHLTAADPVGDVPGATIVIPPAGYVAGAYAGTDGRRGVWKAPAGTGVRLGGVRSFEVNVLDVHQETLNPLAINALRMIPLAGPVIWGARTRDPNSEWRYVPVRRTAIFLRMSIYKGIQWAVFEPNDERLWQSLRNSIGAFMETQFRNGAFAGATSREAYFVKVDQETTTSDDQAAGIVNIVVGFAPLRPAEFVILTLQQVSQRTG